ncbi:B3/B4 domain-containing protein (DNA/RNA-binding domain of Phe-tRNA-synthetase) [Sinosporangium album]|uniref:B3/B4 domain-containing protein (DNA/RNA-binding domain of Phe-tRNA-synthetase) n=1 Tax=Sinosporangium album TaxID=504805 RepID=A0A1G8H861_9ACTN|nr:phenylalanine--tRNA ligase beta subunit-related protein [Sinosporangium album]SDI02690.1 B3/B4 domain-containing protein (DNA/RNA-binding domain of Phe-tRNA-synthetase) [Sinosporangium album]
MEIWVDPAVTALRPDFRVLALKVYGLRNGPSDERSRTWLAGAAEGAAGVDDARLEAWRDAYRAFGAKPQRTRPSVDALLRRMPLPEINLVVDAYNSVSVRHVLPVGGEDLGHYVGAARLVRAEGDETFDAMDKGEVIVDHPEIGEVVWRDDLGVTCRRWNWRQCVRTRITEETTDALFLLERLEPMSMEELSAAGDELTALLKEITPDIRVESVRLEPGKPAATL